METTIPCPGCGTRLNLADTGCPICLRGRSKQEIMRGYARLRDEETRRRRRPFVAAAALLAAWAAGSLLYSARGAISGALTRAEARFSRFYDEMSDPNSLSASAAARRAAPAAAPVAPVPAAPVPAAPPAPPPSAARPAHGRVADLPVPNLSPEQWALRGRVYDLSTLRPAPDVQLIAKAGDSEQAFRSDAEGRYSVILPRQQPGTPGYEIRASDARYAPSTLYEADIPYARLPADERRRLAQSARSGDSHATPVTDVVGEDSVRRDIFLSLRR